MPDCALALFTYSVLLHEVVECVYFGGLTACRERTWGTVFILPDICIIQKFFSFILESQRVMHELFLLF